MAKAAGRAGAKATKRLEEMDRRLTEELFQIAMGDCGAEEKISMGERLKAAELLAKYRRAPEKEGEAGTVTIIDDI